MASRRGSRARRLPALPLRRPDATIRTTWRPIGFGRTGERREKTPAGVSRWRGACTSRSRRAWSSQVSTMIASPAARSRSPARQGGSISIRADPPRSRASRTFFGQSSRLVHGVRARPMKTRCASPGWLSGSTGDWISPGLMELVSSSRRESTGQAWSRLGCRSDGPARPDLPEPAGPAGTSRRGRSRRTNRDRQAGRKARWAPPDRKGRKARAASLATYNLSGGITRPDCRQQRRLCICWPDRDGQSRADRTVIIVSATATLATTAFLGTAEFAHSICYTIRRRRPDPAVGASQQCVGRRASHRFQQQRDGRYWVRARTRSDTASTITARKQSTASVL